MAACLLLSADGEALSRQDISRLKPNASPSLRHRMSYEYQGDILTGTWWVERGSQDIGQILQKLNTKPIQIF